MRYHFENYALDTDRRELRLGADLVPLEPQVFDVLAYLIQNRERVVSKDDLLASVWEGRSVSESALTTRINAARNAIGDRGDQQRLIKTLLRKGVRFVGAVREEQQPTAAAAAQQLALPDRPSISVLPFTNMSGDPSQEYFSDGITEDIITELSRFSELFVIARNSTFQYKGKATDVRQVGRELGARYVLEGSIRRDGDRVRISAQLIDAVSGAHRWAERYDRELKDVFAVQDEVARAIASVLVAHVNKAEAARSLNKPPDAWEAYDHCLRGTDLFSSFPRSMDVERIYEARRHFERSLSLDPTYARAHTMLAATDMATWTNPLDADLLNPATLDRAYRSAQRAVQLDPNLPQARGQLGHVLLYKREHDAAIAEFERACALNPNFTDWRFAAAVMYGGNPDRAADIVTTQMLRDPFYPVNTLVVLGQAYFVARRYAEAVPTLREAVIRAPDFRPARLFLAATYSRLKRLEDARVQAGHVLRLDPGWTISGTPKWLAPFKDIEGTKHFVESLRAAGLPE